MKKRLCVSSLFSAKYSPSVGETVILMYDLYTSDMLDCYLYSISWKVEKIWRVFRQSMYVFFFFARKHQHKIFVYFEYRSCFYLLLHFKTSLNPSVYCFFFLRKKSGQASLKEICHCFNIIAFLLNCNYYINRDARISKSFKVLFSV